MSSVLSFGFSEKSRYDWEATIGDSSLNSSDVKQSFSRYYSSGRCAIVKGEKSEFQYSFFVLFTAKLFNLGKQIFFNEDNWQILLWRMKTPRRTGASMRPNNSKLQTSESNILNWRNWQKLILEILLNNLGCFIRSAIVQKFIHQIPHDSRHSKISLNLVPCSDQWRSSKDGSSMLKYSFSASVNRMLESSLSLKLVAGSMMKFYLIYLATLIQAGRFNYSTFLLQQAYFIFYKSMQNLKDLIESIGGDPYAILESPPNCEPGTLRKNYYALAKKYHPDKNKQQSAKHMFLVVNQAYQWLEQQQNRRVYQNHIKALEEAEKRINSMDQTRKKFAQDLKRREQQYARAQKDMETELKKRKEFFQKKMAEQEEREAIRNQITESIGTQKYYQLVSSFDISWEDGLSFTEDLLRMAFEDYGTISKVTLQTKRNKATIAFNSIDDCTKIVNQFKHPLISIGFHLEKNKREHLLKALQRQKVQKLDLSLNSANLQRFKEIMNRKSGLYKQQYA